MIAIYSATAFLISLYLAYPLFLLLSSADKSEKEMSKETDEVNNVTLILLSYNGKAYLKEKIDFLIKELACFQYYEMIVVDDNSTDGSKELLDDIKDRDNLNIIFKTAHKGIPDSMNIGVNHAKYDYIIFCDQRQKLPGNILQSIVEPLKYKNVGAVSGSISHFDAENGYSFIRRHENYLKSRESKTGNLIGVYGPFYAIKKKIYSVIPDDIILDDLYLSLRILKTKQVELRENCEITDKNISFLYSYKRTRRYLAGFIQILKEHTIISDLDRKQRIMLIWHKYLRLLIPVFLFMCYVSAGLLIFQSIEYLIFFIILTTIGLMSLLPCKFRFQFWLKSLIRINIFYFIALADILLNDILIKKVADKFRQLKVDVNNK